MNLSNLKPTGSSLGLLRAAALAAALATTARAGIFVTNLGEASNSSFGVDFRGEAGFFTTGNFAYTLDSATLRLRGEYFFLGDGTVTYNAFLYSDVGGVPGSQLYALGSHTDTSGNGSVGFDATFSAPGSSALAANTTYWLVAKVNVGDIGFWNVTSSYAETALAGWSLGDTRYSFGNGSVQPSVGQFAIAATAVPEPAAWGLFAAAGLSAFALLRRK